MVLTAKKPQSEAYPKTLTTIGDHLRKRRLDLNLYQKDVAKILGVTTCTVTNWEKNRGGSAVRDIPKIASFLGYDPLTESVSTIGQKIKQCRRRQSLSIKKFARQVDVDPTTLARWEKLTDVPSKSVRKRLHTIGLS